MEENTLNNTIVDVMDTIREMVWWNIYHINIIESYWNLEYLFDISRPIVVVRKPWYKRLLHL